MSISSATSWVDGDPLTPTTLNAKLNPLVDAINAITDSPSVTGSGTSGYVPRWASISTFVSNTTLVNGTIRDYGANGVAVGGEPESAQSFLVYGPSKLSGAVTMSGAVTAGGSVTVTGSVAMTGALTVSGSTTSLNGVQYVWPSSQGSADEALLNDGAGGLRWGLVGGFVDQAIASNAFSVYSVAATDINKRLISSSTTMNPVLMLPSSDLSALDLNSRFQVAAFGRRAYINAKPDAFSSKDTSFTPLVGIEVLAVAIDPDDKILVGGSFLTVGSSNVSYMARLNENGTLDSTFQLQPLQPFNAIYAILVRPTDYLIGCASSGSILRVEPSGAAASFCAVNSDVRTLAQQSDGSVLVGGAFTTIAGSTRTSLARLNANGTIDSTFSSRFSTVGGSTFLRAISLTTANKILIAGSFSGVNGEYYGNIARLNTDGSVDTSFVSSIVTGGDIFSMSVQSDGKIVLAGSFRTVDTTARNRVARLNGDGSLDTTFDPSANNLVYDAAVNPFTGDVALGGVFTTMAGVTRNRAAVVDSVGSLLSINPNFSPINTVTYDGTSRLLFAGQLASASSGIIRYGRLASQASVDTIRSPSVSAMQSLISIPSYGVVTLESRGSGEWVVVDSNY